MARFETTEFYPVMLCLALKCEVKASGHYRLNEMLRAEEEMKIKSIWESGCGSGLLEEIKQHCFKSYCMSPVVEKHYFM